MDYSDIVRFILEVGTQSWDFVQSNWSADKAVAIALAALSFLWGAYIKWRNSGYRMLDRLDDFLEAQKVQIKGSRESVAKLFVCPSPARTLEEPAFSSGAFSRAINRINWGFGAASANDLPDAVRISRQQAELSKRKSDEHKERQALAHLLLGVRSASKSKSNVEDRHAARSEALEHFDQALALNNQDVDALEYSGMMLLELEKADLALQRFQNLVELRKSVPGGELARAYRLLGTAYEKLAQPKPKKAYEYFALALTELPANSVLDRALTHEQLALLSVKLKYTDKIDKNFQAAWTLYNTLRKTKPGREGMDRVAASVAALNSAKSDESSIQSGNTEAKLANAPSQGIMATLFSRADKPSG
jgi:tetratricopeptide (TPR) repeat protein